MKKEFIKAMVLAQLQKKLTAGFSQLRKDSLSEKDIEDFKKGLKQSGFLDALKETGQDPDEIKEIFIEAFNETIQALTKKVKDFSDVIFTEIKKEIAK